jgi:hypothetical protein
VSLDKEPQPKVKIEFGENSDRELAMLRWLIDMARKYREENKRGAAEVETPNSFLRLFALAALTLR